MAAADAHADDAGRLPGLPDPKHDMLQRPRRRR